MSDYADQTVAVLAVQGAFAEHEARLSELGARCIELRQTADLKQDFDRLVLPGGESTVQGKLLDELGMLDALRARIVEGMPVLGTCAGLILLARDLAAHDDKGTPRLATMNVLVERNAYGRQLGSFRTQGSVAGIDGEVPLTFIRAPRIVEVHGDAKALAKVDGRIVAARQGNQLGVTFHPNPTKTPASTNCSYKCRHRNQQTKREWIISHLEHEYGLIPGDYPLSCYVVVGDVLK